MSSKICAHLCINESPFQAVRQPLVDLSIVFPENSRWTKQSFKDEADINTIMARYQATGEIPALNLVAPQYLDATGFDFQAMQEQVLEARALFGELPSVLRARFGNDPGAFLEYVADSSNHDEMRKLGLLKKANAGTAEPPISDGPSPVDSSS